MTTVSAHVQQVGPVGNFPYLALETLPLTPQSGCGYFVYLGGSCSNVYNVCDDITNYGSFTGGTSPTTSTVVAQSDIDNAANNLIQTNQPDAQQVLQGQLNAGEQLAGSPGCQPATSSNHSAGYAASTVTVTVTFTCTGEAYDQAGALTLASRLLTNQAASNPGAGYALVGQIKRTFVSAAAPDSQGNIALVVQAEGVWAYSFSDSQKQALARLIAGKNKQDAISSLMAEIGVAQVSIQITGGDGQKLPTAASQITITVLTVSGL
jgi:VCBS repeat-containing protein